MLVARSLRHCSNKYKLVREGEKDEEKDEGFLGEEVKCLVQIDAANI